MQRTFNIEQILNEKNNKKKIKIGEFFNKTQKLKIGEFFYYFSRSIQHLLHHL